MSKCTRAVEKFANNFQLEVSIAGEQRGTDFIRIECLQSFDYVKLKIEQVPMLFNAAVNMLSSTHEMCVNQKNQFAVQKHTDSKICISDDLGNRLVLPCDAMKKLLLSKDRVCYLLRNRRNKSVLEKIIVNLAVGEFVRHNHNYSTIQESVMVNVDMFVGIVGKLCQSFGINACEREVLDIVKNKLQDPEIVAKFSPASYRLFVELYKLDDSSSIMNVFLGMK